MIFYQWRLRQRQSLYFALLWRFARLSGVIDGCYYADWHYPAQLSFCVSEQVKVGVTSYEMVDSLAMQQAHVCRQCINMS